MCTVTVLGRGSLPPPAFLLDTLLNRNTGDSDKRLVVVGSFQMTTVPWDTLEGRKHQGGKAGEGSSLVHPEFMGLTYKTSVDKMLRHGKEALFKATVVSLLCALCFASPVCGNWRFMHISGLAICE